MEGLMLVQVLSFMMSYGGLNKNNNNNHQINNNNNNHSSSNNNNNKLLGELFEYNDKGDPKGIVVVIPTPIVGLDVEHLRPHEIHL